MAYRKKSHLIEMLRPDMSIIQEISHGDINASKAPFQHWVGKHQAKGLVIMGNATHDFSIADRYADHIPWFVPLIAGDLHILAIWASTSDTTARRYVRLIHEALDHYQDFLRHPQSILIGDFNSNAIFDGNHRVPWHSRMVERLDSAGISSVYHAQTGEAHGSERSPTYFHHRSPAKSYHLDYALVSNSLLIDTRLAIGLTNRYLGPSDHLPLILDIRN